MQPIKNPIGQGHLPDWNDLNTMRGIFRDLGLYDADETGPMLDKSLKSRYHEVGNNKALVTFETMKKILQD